MSRVFWDTNLFIYLFEDYGEYSKDVSGLRQRVISRGDQLFSSTLTLGEILVKPTEKGDDELRRSYLQALTVAAAMLPFDEVTAAHYATIRQARSIKGPDAIELACAAQARIDLFITNDDQVKGKTVAGIQFIASLKGAYI